MTPEPNAPRFAVDRRPYALTGGTTLEAEFDTAEAAIKFVRGSSCDGSFNLVIYDREMRRDIFGLDMRIAEIKPEPPPDSEAKPDPIEAARIALAVWSAEPPIGTPRRDTTLARIAAVHLSNVLQALDAAVVARIETIRQSWFEGDGVYEVPEDCMEDAQRDIRTLLTQIDWLTKELRAANQYAESERQRRSDAEAAAVKQEAVIHLMGRYLNDDDWTAVNRIRETPGWEQHIDDFDITTGKPDAGRAADGDGDVDPGSPYHPDNIGA